MPNDPLTDLSMPPSAHQRSFHFRWGHLRDPHVRDLAWLLDSPNLLDDGAPQWQGKIASLAPDAASRVADWLTAIDQSPGELHALLDIGPFTRLGRYAEKLLVFYFRHCGTLAAHGMQVRADKGETIGEFDFLLREGGRLVHWELATKFYLLAEKHDTVVADYFIGPNLADTLHAKMQKILMRQLALAEHPAAQAVLAEPVMEAKAFIKGWLFLPPDYLGATVSAGVSADYCRGNWVPLSRWLARPVLRYHPLPRLQWLAPKQASDAEVIDGAALQTFLMQSFARDSAPVMVAALERHEQEKGGEKCWREISRTFIVPDDWRRQALERLAPGGALARGSP